jgi:prepilin-type N-terminal cleavage/methylation domain-containing protein
MMSILQKQFRNSRVSFVRKDSADQGMTFIELIVVMGIFAAISSAVLFNYHDFSANAALQNLAQDVALQIKQAQTEAVSGRIPIFPQNSNQAGNPNLIPLGWKPSYGIAFDLNADVGTGWTLGGGGFVYYFNKGPAPLPGNPEVDRDFYDFTYTNYGTCGTLAYSESECLQEIKIKSGDVIDMICLGFTTVDDACTTGTVAPNDQAFISFTRPRGNAIILDGSPDTGGSSPYENIFIRLTSPSGGHKYIEVWTSGYIKVR